MISFQVQDDLIGSTKVNLYELALKDCFRDKLGEDQSRLARASVLLVPVSALGSRFTSLSAGLLFVTPGCMM